MKFKVLAENTLDLNKAVIIYLRSGGIAVLEDIEIYDDWITGKNSQSETPAVVNINHIETIGNLKESYYDH